ncbi:MAG: hypothetical protein EPN38_12020 [Rhodanobacteraceae bacterium]|nr:MAG: hypothetical protein EPN38_12020 [Rhodanobacteraceae bacterium]
MKAHWHQVLALSAVLALIAGCAGGAAPSDGDVNRAVRALLKQQHLTFGAGNAAAVRAPSSRPAAPTRVQNFGCNPAPDHRGYLCEIGITGGQSPGKQPSLNRLVRLVKTARGWQATMQ